jgi:hypothetical protein
LSSYANSLGSLLEQSTFALGIPTKKLWLNGKKTRYRGRRSNQIDDPSRRLWEPRPTAQEEPEFPLHDVIETVDQLDKPSRHAADQLSKPSKPLRKQLKMYGVAATAAGEFAGVGANG